METKTFQSLPPEEKRMLLVIKRVHYQVFYLSSVDETIVSDICCKAVVGFPTMRIRSSSIMVHWYVFNFIFEFP